MGEKFLTDKEVKVAQAKPSVGFADEQRRAQQRADAKGKTRARPARALKPGEAPPEFLMCDGGSLYARVRATSSGEASINWQYFFKWQGKTERLSIGPYPAVSLAEARKRRDAARALLTQDPPLHPVLEARRRAEAARAAIIAEGRQHTVRGLFEDWERVYLSHHRKDGGKSAREYFEHDVFPFIGGVRAKAVGRSDITAILDRILARGARRKANAVLALLKQMFAHHGVPRGIVDTDPTYGFTKRHAGGREASRERVLSVDELKALAWKLRAAGLSEPLQAAVRLILATGVRVGELSHAKWVNVDLAAATWKIPKEDSKNGREHLIHLSAFARAELRTLEAFRQGDWLLASRDGKAAIADKAIAKQLRDRQREKALKGRSTTAVGALRLPGGDWSPHDLRRTFATRLADLGTPPHVVERALNHTMQGVMAVYNRHDYWAERKEALDRWGAELERIFASAPPANVVDLVPKLKARRRSMAGRRTGT